MYKVIYNKGEGFLESTKTYKTIGEACEALLYWDIEHVQLYRVKDDKETLLAF